MPTPDNARQGHVVLSVVLSTLAVGVLLASVVMGWWVRASSDQGMAGTQAAQVVEAAPP